MPAIHPALLTGDAGTSTFPGHYHPFSEAIAEGWRSGAVEALERPVRWLRRERASRIADDARIGDR
jgi:hypothetical protein